MPTNTNVDAQLTVAVDADTSGLQESFNQASKGGVKLGTTLAAALDGVITKGKSVSSVFDSLALNISKMALSAAFKPLEGAFSQFAGGFLSGGGATPFASGGVFAGGLPIPFASGGIISSPIAFPLGAGQTGIAGERGPEAIMPLTRGADGKLGLSGGGSANAVNVTFHVTSPDAESFSRSETQLAALLARAVSQGQRNL